MLLRYIVVNGEKVKRSHGFRRGTRKKLRQKPSVRVTITKFLQKFKPEEKVMILQEPSSQKGMPFPRFRGRVGTITGKRGKSYIVEMVVGKKKKTIISRAEHLKRL